MTADMKTVISCLDSYPHAGFIALFLLSHKHTHAYTQRNSEREAGLLERALKHININCSSSWNDNIDKMPL